MLYNTLFTRMRRENLVKIHIHRLQRRFLLTKINVAEIFCKRCESFFRRSLKTTPHCDPLRCHEHFSNNDDICQLFVKTKLFQLSDHC